MNRKLARQLSLYLGIFLVAYVLCQGVYLLMQKFAPNTLVKSRLLPPAMRIDAADRVGWRNVNMIQVNDLIRSIKRREYDDALALKIEALLRSNEIERQYVGLLFARQSALPEYRDRVLELIDPERCTFENLRPCVLAALASIGSKEDLPLIEQYLESEDSGMREAADEAMEIYHFHF